MNDKITKSSTTRTNSSGSQSTDDENPIRLVSDMVHQTDERSSQKTKSIDENGSWGSKTGAKKEMKSQDSERKLGTGSTDKVSSLFNLLPSCHYG